MRVLDVRPISFELPAVCSVVKYGAEAGGTARKRKHAYSGHQRERVNQVPNKKLVCIPAHVGAKELDLEFREAKQADRSLIQTKRAENP